MWSLPPQRNRSHGTGRIGKPLISIFRTAHDANPVNHARLKEQDTNQFTNLPYTQKYKKLLGKRKELPAFARMDEFYKVVRMMRAASV